MAGNKLQSLRGIHDGLANEVSRWQRVETAARKIFSRYAYSEVRLPVLEPTELFVRSIGEATDIVAKEMYTFTDQGGDFVCLRPEGTAGAVRAYLQGGLTRAGSQRWYYIGPMFRRERPQKGRLRQFQQIGVEMFGQAGPIEDAELLAMAHAFLTELGISGLHLEINSLGCPACRPAYRDKLVVFLTGRAKKLCDTCQERLEKNPLRVLDCKLESCQKALVDAPEMAGHLCEQCETHFDGLRQGLDALSVPYIVNPRIVRGLDYYNRTAFEVVTDQLGAQGTVLAGGRYDGLVQELGGPATPAIGFAAGIERLAMLLDEVEAAKPVIAVVAIGNEVMPYALQQAATLRAAGISVVFCGGGSAKRQFRMADREGVRFVVVIGEDEMKTGRLTIKNMRSGEQRQLEISVFLAEFNAGQDYIPSP